MCTTYGYIYIISYVRHFHLTRNCSCHNCSVAFLRLVREQLALAYRLRPAPAASAELDGAGKASSDAEDEDEEDGSGKAKRARKSDRSAPSAGKLKPKPVLAASTPKLLVSCIGLGLSNMARAQI